MNSYCIACRKSTYHKYWRILARYFRQCIECNHIIHGVYKWEVIMAILYLRGPPCLFRM